MASIQTRPNGTIVIKESIGTGKNRKQPTIAKFGKGPAARAEAEEFLRAYNDKKKAQEEQELDPSAPIQPGQPVYADQLAVLWHADKKAAGRAEWVDVFANILNKEILPEISQVPVEQLSQHFLVSLMHRIKKDRSPTTVDRYLSYMKCMFEWGRKHGYITKNPLALWTKRKTKQKDFTLTFEDVMKLIAVAAPHAAWAILMAVNIGVRTGESELLSLEWRNVDWENSCIRIYGRKTMSWRTVPVSDEFLEKLRQKQSEAQTPYIIEYQGRKIKSISGSFRTACQKAGLPDEIISYDLRHLFCSTLLSRGANPRTVAALMGHANSSMVMEVYGHCMPGDGERAVALLPKL